MATKKITLYYNVTSEKVWPPGPGELQRKEAWLWEVQRSLPPRDHKMVKVTYELFNPEVERQRKFLNGPVIDYWIIQSQERLGEITPTIKKQARETLFDRALGYDIELLGGVKARRRKSTADFMEVQQMHDFLEMLRETEFEPNGYEFPDSEEFWKMAGAYGEGKAREMALDALRKRMQAKLST